MVWLDATCRLRSPEGPGVGLALGGGKVKGREKREDVTADRNSDSGASSCASPDSLLGGATRGGLDLGVSAVLGFARSRGGGAAGAWA